MAVIGARWLVTGCAVVAVGAGAVLMPQLVSSAPVTAPTVATSLPSASARPLAPPVSPPSASSAPASSAPPASPSAAHSDSRKGAALARPFVVDGVIVVSAKHRTSAGYRPKVTGPAPLAPDARAAFARLTRAAGAKGLRFQVVSGYRSYASQRALYASSLRRYGRAYTVKYVAVPGTSEHQTGLAVDLRSPSGRGTGFDKTKEWRWLRAHAQDYGFVLRYPKGKTKVTGIGYEPWHWRYVGVAAAKAIGVLGPDVTLEEYLGLA